MLLRLLLRRWRWRRLLRRRGWLLGHRSWGCLHLWMVMVMMLFLVPPRVSLLF